jgi:hypothetical protein
MIDLEVTALGVYYAELWRRRIVSLNLQTIDHKLRNCPVILMFREEQGGEACSEIFPNEKELIAFAETFGFIYYENVDLNGLIDIGIDTVTLDSYCRDVLYNGGRLNIAEIDGLSPIGFDVSDGVSEEVAAFERLYSLFHYCSVNTFTDVLMYLRGTRDLEQLGISEGEKDIVELLNSKVFDFYAYTQNTYVGIHRCN